MTTNQVSVVYERIADNTWAAEMSLHTMVKGKRTRVMTLVESPEHMRNTFLSKGYHVAETARNLSNDGQYTPIKERHLYKI